MKPFEGQGKPMEEFPQSKKIVNLLKKKKKKKK